MERRGFLQRVFGSVVTVGAALVAKDLFVAGESSSPNGGIAQSKSKTISDVEPTETFTLTGNSKVWLGSGYMKYEPMAYNVSRNGHLTAAELAEMSDLMYRCTDTQLADAFYGASSFNSPNHHLYGMDT